MPIKLFVLAALALPLPAAAQDTAIVDHAQTQLHSVLGARRIQQAQQRQQDRSPAAVEARARATCADKQRVAAGLPPAKGRQLMDLCARLGL